MMLQVVSSTGVRMEAIPAVRITPHFAVHGSINLESPHRWTVTHIATGFSAGEKSFPGLTQAVSAALELEALPIDWSVARPKSLTRQEKSVCRHIVNSWLS